MIVVFQTRLGKILFWQKFSWTWEPDFNDSQREKAILTRKEKWDGGKKKLVEK